VALEVEQAHDRDEAADVERRSGRVESVVPGDRPAARETGRQTGRRRMEHPAPFELGEEAGKAA
jgi:hypothetical protein